MYRRLPDDTRIFQQELLHDGPECKVSLLLVDAGIAPLKIGDIRIEAGGAVMWFLFPGRTWEVAAVYDRSGRRLGTYTNFVRVPELSPGRWRITDLYLDVWQPDDGAARLLDEADLDEAVAEGLVGAEEAAAVRAEAEAVLRAAEAGRWPPRVLRDYPLDDVDSLRLRRDVPGTYFANLLVSRVIAFGIYALGAVSLTSLAFAALTDAFHGDRTGLVAWMVAVGLEMVVLLGLSLAGRLPATRRPRPEEVLSERILFLGALVMGLAVFVNPSVRAWRDGLVGIYGALFVFFSIFAIARFRWENRFPVLAVAGALVCIVALIVLL